MSMEFGPNLSKPIAPRLKMQFPQLTAEELEYCEGLCKKIKKDAFDFLDQRYMDLSDHDKYKQMQADMKTYLHPLYPWIQEKNMSYLFSQNVYLVSK